MDGGLSMKKQVVIYGGRMSKLEREFELWWYNEGSGVRPSQDEDVEEFTKRIAKFAWFNGNYKAVTK